MNMFREWRVSKLFFHIDVPCEMFISQCIALPCLDTSSFKHFMFYVSTEVNQGKEIWRKKPMQKRTKQNKRKNLNLIFAEANNFRFLCSQNLIWFLVFSWGTFPRKGAYASISVVLFTVHALKKQINTKTCTSTLFLADTLFV